MNENSDADRQLTGNCFCKPLLYLKKKKAHYQCKSYPKIAILLEKLQSMQITAKNTNKNKIKSMKSSMDKEFNHSE